MTVIADILMLYGAHDHQIALSQASMNIHQVSVGFGKIAHSMNLHWAFWPMFRGLSFEGAEI
jgi:hypothetical protein